MVTVMKRWVLGILSLTMVAAAAGDDHVGKDVLEPFNRTMFAFNEALDKAIVKPIAKAYVLVTPDAVELGIANVFDNLDEVTNAANSGLQGKGSGMAASAGRFFINSTLGIGGLFDVADSVFHIQKGAPEDFGQTLAAWGVGEGPYLMLPLMGPSSLRDAPSKFVDSITNPLKYVSDIPARNSARGLGLVALRADLLGAGDLVTGDRYVFVRDIYHQRQRYLINDGMIEDDFGDDDY